MSLRELYRVRTEPLNFFVARVSNPCFQPGNTGWKPVPQERDMTDIPVNFADPHDDPVLAPGHTNASVTDKIGDLVLRRPPGRLWWFGVVMAMGLASLLMVAVTYLFAVGVGIWGVNIPVAWGFAIVNFVWWIGIGHAGTLISALLLLLR